MAGRNAREAAYGRVADDSDDHRRHPRDRSARRSGRAAGAAEVMEIRKHPITGDPIVFAPQRAGRPNAFARDQNAACPFCPGNESETPPEITHRGNPWEVRAFPNKYPAVDGHEVIVESPDHGAQHVSNPLAVEVYVERYQAH